MGPPSNYQNLLDVMQLCGDVGGEHTIERRLVVSWKSLVLGTLVIPQPTWSIVSTRYGAPSNYQNLFLRGEWMSETPRIIWWHAIEWGARNREKVGGFLEILGLFVEELNYSVKWNCDFCWFHFMYWKCQCFKTHLLSGANMKIKRFRQTVKLENHRAHHSLSPSLFFSDSSLVMVTPWAF